ncbi:MAG: hypothetical protein M1348_01840 [Candidatus Parvarchaeota archaeon]|nr:hypothetical protein [Candidatus Parvarchaeota archaeon]MCL5101332.1 hypothetical protein [Candidatus Parvarchaeota archaeon]
MYIDLISKRDKSLIDELKALGFGAVFCPEKDSIRNVLDPEPFDLKMYAGDDYEFVITKGKADAVTDLEKSGFLLNKGLCSKLKENKIFVIFKFKSLVESPDFFRTYKNFLINGRLCSDYSVPSLFVSFAGDLNEVKSPIQLAAFAENFRYNYNNYRKSLELLLKRT